MSTQIRRNLPAIIEGDDVTHTMQFTDGDGNAIDISDWTVFVTVKDKLRDSDDDALISKDITSHDDAVNGKTSFSFTSSETADLDGGKHYDIQLKKADDSIQTILKGSVHFKDGVTTRTTS